MILPALALVLADSILFVRQDDIDSAVRARLVPIASKLVQRLRREEQWTYAPSPEKDLAGTVRILTSQHDSSPGEPKATWDPLDLIEEIRFAMTEYLNRLGRDGWRVTSVIPMTQTLAAVKDERRWEYQVLREFDFDMAFQLALNRRYREISKAAGRRINETADLGPISEQMVPRDEQDRIRDRTWGDQLGVHAHDGWRLCARLDRSENPIELAIQRRPSANGVYDQATYLLFCRPRKVDLDATVITKDDLETAVHDQLFPIAVARMRQLLNQRRWFSRDITPESDLPAVMRSLVSSEASEGGLTPEEAVGEVLAAITGYLNKLGSDHWEVTAHVPGTESLTAVQSRSSWVYLVMSEYQIEKACLEAIQARHLEIAAEARLPVQPPQADSRGRTNWLVPFDEQVVIRNRVWERRLEVLAAEGWTFRARVNRLHSPLDRSFERPRQDRPYVVDRAVYLVFAKEQ